MIKHIHTLLALLFFLHMPLISMEPMDTAPMRLNDNIFLLTSDSKHTFVEKKHLKECLIFKDLLTDCKDTTLIPLSEIKTPYTINRKIIKYLLLPCLKNVHIINSKQASCHEKTVAHHNLNNFLKKCTNYYLHILINNANYFAVPYLLNLALKHWALRGITDQELELFCANNAEHFSQTLSRQYFFSSDIDKKIGTFLINRIIPYLIQNHLSHEHISHRKLLNKKHTHGFMCAKFNPSGTMIAAGCKDKKIYLGTPTRGQCIGFLTGHTATVRALKFDRTEKLIASGAQNGIIHLWDLETKKVIKTFTGHLNTIKDIHFSPNQKLLASCSADRTIRVWDIESGTCKHILQGHTNDIWKLHFDNDTTIYSASTDKTIRVWDLKTNSEIKRFTPSFGELSINHKKTLIATDTRESLINLINPINKNIVGTLQGHTAFIFALDFSPDDTLLASASRDETIRIWNIKTKQCLRILRHDNMINSICFSPDGNSLLSVSADNTVRIWNIFPKTIRDCLFNLSNHTSQEQGRLLTLAYYKILANQIFILNEHLTEIFNQFNPEIKKFLQKHLPIWLPTPPKQRKRKQDITDSFKPSSPKRRKKLDR